jgi:hypothetical protein
MERIKVWVQPAILIVVWITVVSYTISLAATFEPALRIVGQQS